MAQEITSTIQDLVSAWNSHDPERVAAFYAPDYEGEDVGEATLQHGPQGIVQTYTRALRAFPDLTMTADAILVQAERGALFWTATATHRGPLMSIPATGRPVSIKGVSLLTVKEGQISRGLYIWDVAGVLRALGLLPDLK